MWERGANLIPAVKVGNEKKRGEGTHRWGALGGSVAEKPCTERWEGSGAKRGMPQIGLPKRQKGQNRSGVGEIRQKRRCKTQQEGGKKGNEA